MATPKKPTDPFTSRPPEDQMKSKYALIRVPGKGYPPVIALSHDVLGANTHYSHGRTRPCAGEDCQYCEEEQLPRWRGYIAVATPDMARVAFIELTPACMKRVDEYFRRHRTLKGATLSFKRKNDRDNGELWVAIKPPPANQPALPKAPSTRKFLEALWQLKPAAAAKSNAAPPRVYPPEDGPDFGDEQVA